MDNPRARATYEVHRAIELGRLPRITCMTMCVDCGKQATEYDHRDYDKPLEVEPVCRSCNAKRGEAANAGFVIRIVLYDTPEERTLAEYIRAHARANMRTLSAQAIYMMRAQMGASE